MTAPELPFDPAEVRRVHHDNGSYPLPPLQLSWPPLARLVWHARLIEVDEGMPPGTLVVTEPRPGQFALHTPDSWVAAHQPYHQLWTDLIHLAKGWRVARAVDARAAAAG